MKDGDIEITGELADGWYRGSCGALGRKNQYGFQTKLLAQLEIIDSLDHMLVINTDKSWKWSNDGMIRFADNKDGEIIEAWRKPTYNNFAKEAKYSVLPVSSNNVFITEHEKFDVKNVITTPNNSKVLDFG